MKPVTILLAAALAACAPIEQKPQPWSSVPRTTCTKTAVRDAGMVRVERCVEWKIGGDERPAFLRRTQP